MRSSPVAAMMEHGPATTGVDALRLKQWVESWARAGERMESAPAPAASQHGYAAVPAEPGCRLRVVPSSLQAGSHLRVDRAATLVQKKAVQ